MIDETSSKWIGLSTRLFRQTGSQSKEGNYSSIRVNQLLWLAVGLSMLADLLVTFEGLQLGLVEMNPIARWAFVTAGFGALVGIKLLVVLVAVYSWLVLPRSIRPFIPAILATPWMLAFLNNLHLLLSL